jgi:hypothetical protein
MTGMGRGLERRFLNSESFVFAWLEGVWFWYELIQYAIYKRYS